MQSCQDKQFVISHFISVQRYIATVLRIVWAEGKHWDCEETELQHYLCNAHSSMRQWESEETGHAVHAMAGVAQVPGLSGWQFLKYWIIIFALWQPLFHLVLFCHIETPCVLLATELRQMVSKVHLPCSSTELAIHGPREALAVSEQKYRIFCRINYKHRNTGKTGLTWTLRWVNLNWLYKSKVLNETRRIKKLLQNYII